MRNSDILKNDILVRTKQYYIVKKKEDEKTFIQGKSKINYAGRFYDEKELQNLVSASLDFWLTSGEWTQKFETQLAKFLDVKYSFLVNSGSSANLLAFMTLTSPTLKDRQIKRGDEIITVACCFPTTVAPILQYGAVPVFVDVDLSGNIDCNLLEQALTLKTKAVMIAHTLGNPFDIKAVKEFCEKHNLWLISDCCDSLGSKYNGKSLESYSDISTSSFYPPHMITTGQGGSVHTNCSILKKIIMSMRDWGRDCTCETGQDNKCGRRFTQKFGDLPFGFDHKYIYSEISYNLQATDLQASIGVAQLEKLPSFIKARQDNFKYLYNGLKELDKYFYLPEATSNSDPCWFGFLLVLKDKREYYRNKLTTFLEERQIQTRNLFAGNIILHPMFNALQENIDYKIIGDLINTNIIMNDAFWIGVYPGMTKEHLDYMIKSIKDFCIEYLQK